MNEERQNLRMTRNDYSEWCKQMVAAGRIKEMMNEKVDIIPLDLSDYPLITEETGKWLNALFMHEYEDKNGNYMLLGDCRNAGGYFRECQKIKCDCVGVDGYSAYGYNDKELLLYTYCEHDTTCTLFKDKEKYDAAKKEMIRWYEEEY